jgi:hypothetical protein
VGPDILDRITNTGEKGDNITVHYEPWRRHKKADRYIQIETTRMRETSNAYRNMVRKPL